MKMRINAVQTSRLFPCLEKSETSWKPVLFWLALLAVWNNPAVSLHAAVLTVTSLADSGLGSLRDQIAASSSGDTIQFAVTGVIPLNSSITIPHALAVQGPGPLALVLDLASKDRAFVITAYPTIVSGMTIMNGMVKGQDGADGGVGQDGSDAPVSITYIFSADGGAILATNAGGVLILSNCWLAGNMVVGGHGGRGGDAGATARAGKGGNGGPAGGGAISTVVTNLTLINCTFSQNRVMGGQGGDGGNSMNSTVAGGNGGSGAWCAGGALGGESLGNINIINCTFSGNQAAGGGGGQGGSSTGAGGMGGVGNSGYGGALDYSWGNLLSCTIVQNDALAGTGGVGGAGSPAGANGASGSGSGGGIYADAIGCPNRSRMANTILADNYAATSCSNYSASFTDDGYNFIGSVDYSGCPFGATTQAGTVAAPIHPQLSPLMQNGGGLPTQAPVFGGTATTTSPVIDAGYSFGLTTDERGAPRPYSFGLPRPAGGDGSDIGAFELGSGDLSAAMSSSNVVLSWPAYYGDFTLQSSPSLQGSNNWSDVPDTPVVAGNQLVVTNRATNSMAFYRLIIH